MVEKRVREAVDSIRYFLKDHNIKVDKIIVFGSYAKGNYTKDSDLDIAIISEDFEGKDIFQKAEMLKGLNWSLAKRFTFPFDIIPISRKDWQESSSLLVEFIKGCKVNSTEKR